MLKLGSEDDQQIPEKMLNIANHQQNADQTTRRYHLTPVRVANIRKKHEEITSVDEDVEKLVSYFGSGLHSMMALKC